MKTSVAAAVVFLFIICLAHLLRFVFRVEIVAGGIALPLWMSLIAAIVTGSLAAWLLSDSRK